MDPKSRWELERQEAKQQREISIIEAAERVFIKKGYDKATMRDIAAEDNVGIATVFRYFPKKDRIVVAVASRIIGAEFEAFKTISEQPETGIRKIEMLFDHFIADTSSAYMNRNKLIEAFESYAAQQAEPLDGIEEYNEVTRKVYGIFKHIIQDCIDDGSIRSDIPVHETLATLVNALGIFSKKLSLQSHIVMFEADPDMLVQLTIVKEIFLEYLKPKA
ncbi:TetR/AcrR family transcriptional regulator [Paenibacillus chibensis]|uniref:TetR/AcrR family transcriptional regulator n=1 Tax=Paenibacillus chibensis TaxID=59846 RepID=UPI000FDAC5CB|nr:TetR/AcrR family transcriptional regulator [Paenibacillus chibensis]MEC0368837.1 helix-turn-helix domain containing protein [Paenibacillus chibensis]